MDWGIDGTADDWLTFEPGYQQATAGISTYWIYDPGANTYSYRPFAGQAAPVLNTWQTWDAYNGLWWSTARNTVYGPSGWNNGPPLSTLSDYVTWAGGTPKIVGGLSLRVGSGSPGDTFAGYLDNVYIKFGTVEDQWNFDPPQLRGAGDTPEPATWLLIGGGGLAGWVRRRRRTARAAR